MKNHFHLVKYRGAVISPKAKLFNRVKQVGYIKTNSEIEALILEAKLIKKHQPKYNIVWKDDKNYFYVEITNEELPRVFLTHQIKFKNQNAKCKITIQNAKFIGPFVEGTSLKRTLTYLRKVFPYYTAKSHPKGSCLWCSLKLCPGPNPNRKEYQKNIRNLVAVLKGKSKSVLINLKKVMKELSLVQNYEKAAKVRDQISQLEKVIAHSRIIEPGWLTETKVAKPELKLGRIEAYDISNIQGKEATGSMVVFMGGKPDKSQYRKFKIQIAGKPDDIAMIKEVLDRRLKHPEWPYPDLILIDGGKAQLNAAIKVKSQKSKVKSAIQNSKVMAIAKKKNELYMEGRKNPVLLKTLPREMFNLILQLRDEAHRFAISYHRKLRERELLKK